MQLGIYLWLYGGRQDWTSFDFRDDVSQAYSVLSRISFVETCSAAVRVRISVGVGGDRRPRRIEVETNIVRELGIKIGSVSFDIGLTSECPWG